MRHKPKHVSRHNLLRQSIATRCNQLSSWLNLEKWHQASFFLDVKVASNIHYLVNYISLLLAEIEDQDVQQAADAINVISLEEVQVSDSISTQYKPAKYKNKTDSKKSSGCYPQQKESNAMKKAKAMTQGTSGKSQYMVSAGASEDIMRSGHLEFGTLWASNDSQVGRQPMMVNVVNAPNNSTLQCGCENISCPFCNLMLNIERTDPSVLQ